MENRDKLIIRTSVICIIINVILAAFKAVVGILSNSIAIVIDAINTVVDALANIITIVGTKMAQKKADKDHPLGHGRIEYIATLIVASLIFYTGIHSAFESFQKLINPETPNYSAVTIIVIAVAAAVKFGMGVCIKRIGEKASSEALSASGTDAIFDSFISASILVSAIIFLTTGLNLEAYVGLIIAAAIIKTGAGLLSDALNNVIGKRMDRSFLNNIRQTMIKDDEVLGVYELILHSYGPNRYIGSVGVEVSENLTAGDISRMQRRIFESVLQAHNVYIVGINIYTTNSDNDEIRDNIMHLVIQQEGVLQFHGLSADKENKKMNVSIIIDYDIEDRGTVFRQFEEKLKNAYPDWEINLFNNIDI